MIINFNDVLSAFSFGLDCVESEIVGVSSGHAKRVAFICAKIGEKMELGDDELIDLVSCAVLHDCALTEYIKIEYGKKDKVVGNEKNDMSNIKKLGIHCAIGEKNIEKLPFKTDVCGAVLYHHENCDGSGPFGKKADEIPLFAKLIRFADGLDASFDLSNLDYEKVKSVYEYIENCKGILFDKEICDIFFEIFQYEFLDCLQNSKIDYIIKSIPQRKIKYAENQLKIIAEMFAKIIDYKSEFTTRHSIGIAEKAEIMAKFYGFDRETTLKLYFAGAVHDIGKLVISNDVLEKPDKLTDDEYIYIKSHAFYTYEILRKIDGFDDITEWASFHHEKLDGKGYPFGKKAEALDKKCRLLACLDIYQALVEKRPYKDGMPHEKAISVLRDMADRGYIDGEIVSDIEKVFG